MNAHNLCTMMSFRSHRLTLKFSHANIDRRYASQMRRALAPSPRLISSTQHHGHIHHTFIPSNASFQMRGNAFHSTRRAITSAVDGIKVRRELSATQNYLSRRRFGTLDDDFDIPALDLMTPSLSIPLPPNMMSSNAKITPPSSVSSYSDDMDIPPLDLSNLKLSAPLRRPPQMTKKATSDAGEGGSLLSEGIEKMKKKLDLDGKISSNQRGKLRHALQKMKKTPAIKESNDIPSSQHIGTDPKESLLARKEEITQWLDEKFPCSSTGRTPKITDGFRMEKLTQLNNELEEIEKAWLNVNSGEDDPILSARLQSRMAGLRILKEYGLTKSQLKKLMGKLGKSNSWNSHEEKLAVVRKYQEAYYAENAPFDHADPPSTSLQSPLARHDKPASKSAIQPSSRGLGEFPFPDFLGDLITTQANGTIMGQSGSTSVLTTVVLGAQDSPYPSPLSHGEKEKESVSIDDRKQSMAKSLLLSAIQQADAQSGATFIPLQVDYRERYHASGKIPSNIRRRDNSGPLSDREVLAARVVDRTVRPWLMMGLASSSSSETGSLLPENIVVNCEVQSYDPRPFVDQSDGGVLETQRTHADPIALAINSTIAALYQSAYSSPNTNFAIPLEAAACVKLAISRNGTTIFDPTPKELDECKLELLYAGTKDRVLMLEFSSNGGLPRSDGVNGHSVEDPGVDESTVADAIRQAHEAILPIIEKQEELREKYLRDIEARALEKDEALMTDQEVAQLLGLESPMAGSEVVYVDPINNQDGMKIIDEAKKIVWTKVKHVALKLFGYNGDEKSDSLVHEGTAHVHEGALLAKKVRGRRENVLQSEITRVLRDEFMPYDEELAIFYRSALNSSECLGALTNHIHEGTMKKAMAECAKRKLRSDGRRGLNVVRPISATAPILPDSVHGSALFSRGETQVMCTATVGAPKEGLPIVGPYAEIPDEGTGKSEERSDNEKVPVGSLRFLRNQAEMESDMNSRRVLAGREMTGDSGILSEVKRAFLHYDFPDFSTGVVRSRVGASANRRAIGHGNLAEKAILPALPHLNDFPYTIRLTSEVTSSNGSSSMASACGSTLALLDAGVPLVSPVAGVSVGLAPSSDELLLDITGTEDHYGDMDFKICGTYGGITAMQLDVKRPLELDTVTNALDLAKEGRQAILNAMENECKNTLPGLQPRISMKSTAPRVEIVRFDPNRKRDLIGPGGAVLRQLEDRFRITLDLSQDGQCLIFGPLSSVSKAKTVIMDLVSDVEEGGVYEGTVIEIKDFGAVIELLRNKEGLLHVSEIVDTADRHPGGNIGLVKDHLKVGDKIEVLCTKIDHVQGSIRLSRKKLLQMRKNNFDTVTSTSMSQGDSFPSNRTSKYSQVQTVGETISTGYSLPQFSNNATINLEKPGSSVGNTTKKDEVEDMMEEIAQIINTDSQDVDEGGSNDGGTDDDENSFDMDVSDDEEDLEVSESLEAANPSPSLEALWMERYNELMQFKRVTGHCHVSSRNSEYPQLASWVRRQRAQYKKGGIPDDRVQRLNDIGFAWSRSSLD
mmetsp:Transcript_30623/g.64788  ORF Transcript_30623/g.64788 Transcript_30623/m.64788 type:complete len:1530 (+) Transcript_30623:69-4658(+)